MKKTRKNRYAGSQPEARYGLGTRKSLYLDRPTSHGGWPEGEYDPPINDRIYDYLKSMGLVQEEYLRQTIRGILNEAEPSDEYDGKALMADIEKWDKEAESAQKNALWTIAKSATKFFGAALGKIYMDFADQLISGEFKESTFDFITKTFPDLVIALKDKSSSEEEAKRKAADLVIRSAFSQLHNILFAVGVVWDPADLLDAILYLLEGKPKLATLSILFTLTSLIPAIASRNPATFIALNPAAYPIIIGALVSAIDKFKANLFGDQQLIGDQQLSKELEDILNEEMTKIKESLKYVRGGEAIRDFFDDLGEEMNSPQAKIHKENAKRLLDKINQIKFA